MPHEEIALAFGVSLPTLKKHLSTELSTGAHQRRMDVLDALHSAAVNKGNAAAAKAYLGAVPQAAAPDPDPEQEPLGKKAQAHEAAKTAQAGTGWEGILPGGTGSRIQ